MSEIFNEKVEQIILNEKDYISERNESAVHNKQIVLYDNVVNSVALKNFNAIDLDLLMAILSKLKNESNAEITVSFSELKNLVNYKQKKKSIGIAFDSMYDKLLDLKAKIRLENKIIGFVLFEKYEIDFEKKEITVIVQKDALPLFNDLTSKFTSFELRKLVNLKSVYAKSMFRILNQFKYTGFFKVGKMELLELLGAPQSYAKKSENIRAKILKPILNELRHDFKDLKITEVRSRAQGRPIVGYEFRFQPVELKKTKSFKKVKETLPEWAGKELHNNKISNTEQAEKEMNKISQLLEKTK